jgi:Na+/melibiose symporter-like transporter
MLAPPYLGTVMVLDCAKYNTLRGKPSMEASMSAVTNFGSNIGQGIGTAALGFLLSLGGYAGTADVQSDGALFMIRLCVSFIPAVLYVAMLVFAQLFDLEKKLPAMEAKEA